MLPVLNFDEPAELISYIGTEEISQACNPGAYSRLFIVEDGVSVAKLYDGQLSTKDSFYSVSLLDAAKKNLENARLISTKLYSEAFPHLVLPKRFISFRKNIVGYVMPFIKGKTLSKALEDSNIPHVDKIEWFNDLATIILSLPEDVFVGDLHPHNVLIDDEGRVFLIDIDGFSLSKGWRLTCPASYLEGLPQKYYDSDGNFLVNRNSDILCLFRLFFKYLFDGWDFLTFPVGWRHCLSEYIVKRCFCKKFSEASSCLFSNNNNYLYDRMFTPWGNIDPNCEFDRFLSITNLITEENTAQCFLSQFIHKRKE